MESDATTTRGLTPALRNSLTMIAGPRLDGRAVVCGDKSVYRPTRSDGAPRLYCSKNPEIVMLESEVRERFRSKWGVCRVDPLRGSHVVLYWLAWPRYGGCVDFFFHLVSQFCCLLRLNGGRTSTVAG